jgi:hypothetical protein
MNSILHTLPVLPHSFPTATQLIFHENKIRENHTEEVDVSEFAVCDFL